MNNRLEELRRRFIVPDGSILPTPKQRKHVENAYYCPYAPCCSQCKGIFTLKEALDHLRRVHEHDIERIKYLVSKGLPQVQMKTRRG